MRPTTETEREIVGICQAALDRAGERSALNYGAIQAVTRVDARTIVLSIVPDGSFFFRSRCGIRVQPVRVKRKPRHRSGSPMPQARRTRVRVGWEGREKRAPEPGETVREKTLVRP
jgi:hypothetical protein